MTATKRKTKAKKTLTASIACPEGCEHADAGDVHLGIAGALGTLQVERCDACERFESDEAAEKHVRKILALAPQLVEELDNVAASLENCLAHHGKNMPTGDVQSRTRRVDRAKLLVAIARADFDPLSPPHYCPDHATEHGIYGEVQTELQLIEEGQEAASNYTPKQVRELKAWLELAREYQRLM